jgi:hypothetical protein
MVEWTRPSVDRDEFDQLQERRVNPKAAKELEWRVLARSEVESRLKENEVVSFVPFHLLGFGLPVHLLLRWLLYYYGLCLHDLTPEGILHLSVFIMLCEGFLGIPAHYDLWRILF